ncbi:unnamed protein product [Chrysoparadoxa australica]
MYPGKDGYATKEEWEQKCDDLLLWVESLHPGWSGPKRSSCKVIKEVKNCLRFFSTLAKTLAKKKAKSLLKNANNFLRSLKKSDKKPLKKVNAWFSRTFGGADWPDYFPLQEFVKRARKRKRWLWSVGLCAKLYEGIINRGLKGSCPFPVVMRALHGAFGQGMDAELFCSDLVPYCMGLLDLGVASAAIKQQLQWSRDKLLDDRDVLGLFSVLQLIGVRAVELELESELAMPILCLGKDACNALIGASYLTETVTPGTAVPVMGWNANGHTKLIRRWRGVPCMHPSAFLHLATEAKRLTREQQQDVDPLPLLLKQIHLAREKHDSALLACCKRCLPPEEAAAGPAITPIHDDVLSRAWAGHHHIKVNALSRKQLVQMWWQAGGFDPGWWDRDAALLADIIKWVASIPELFN